MALWIMGFGGTVPIGNLIAGPLIEATSVTTVVLAGAVDRRRASPRTPTSHDRAPSRRGRRRVPTERGAAARRSRPATRLPLTSTASPAPSAPSGGERAVESATSVAAVGRRRRRRSRRMPSSPASAPIAACSSSAALAQLGHQPEHRGAPARPAARPATSSAAAIDVGLAL